MVYIQLRPIYNFFKSLTHPSNTFFLPSLDSVSAKASKRPITTDNEEEVFRGVQKEHSPEVQLTHLFDTPCFLKHGMSSRLCMVSSIHQKKGLLTRNDNTSPPPQYENNCHYPRIQPILGQLSRTYSNPRQMSSTSRNNHQTKPNLPPKRPRSSYTPSWTSSEEEGTGNHHYVDLSIDFEIVQESVVVAPHLAVAAVAVVAAAAALDERSNLQRSATVFHHKVYVRVFQNLRDVPSDITAVM